MSSSCEDLAYRQHRAATAPRPDAFVAAHSAIVAGMVATEALRALLGVGDSTRAVAMVVGLDGLSISHEEVLAVPGCSACQAASGAKR